MGGERIILGTRGSDLALAQARLVEEALHRSWPGLEIAVEVIRTSGDEHPNLTATVDRRAGRKGVFTREIEKALVVRRIDLAVHSAKDLPSASRDDLELRATLPRASTDDVLITKNDGTLSNLPAGAIVATGSVRRHRQLGWKRPDLRIFDLRGNVPTRLRKLYEHEDWSGIILARAGLERLGLTVNSGILPQEDFLPAGGQGVIALQVRRDDEWVQRIVDPINENTTNLCLRAEREFLRLLNGDCDCPVGVHAQIDGNGEMILRAQVFENHRPEPRTGVVQSDSHDQKPEAAAHALYSLMYEQG